MSLVLPILMNAKRKCYFLLLNNLNNLQKLKKILNDKLHLEYFIIVIFEKENLED